MSPARYAEGTEVPVERSKAQIQAMLRQRGASQYVEGWDALTGDRIQFRLQEVTIRFTLPHPEREAFLHDGNGRERRPDVVDKFLAQANRQRWRALYLVIRAKLEAVDAGIAVYEEEFMAFVVTASGKTVGEIVLPRLPEITDGRRVLQAENPR